MTITAFTVQPGNLVGPGLQLQLFTSFAGTIPSGSFWELLFDQPSVVSGTRLNVEWPTFSIDPTSVTGYLLADPLKGDNTIGNMMNDDVSTSMSVNLRSPTSILDSGTFTVTWDARTGLGMQALKIAQQQSAAGGLTPAQQTQLTTTESNTSTLIDNTTVSITDASGTTTPFSIGEILGTKSLSDLTTTEITSGPTGSPVTRFLTAFVFGIIVRITAVPPTLTPQTPDGDYWLASLAVVRIRHGTDLFLRRPVHTSSAIISWDRGIYQIATQAIETAVWPSGMALEVDWAPGVEGQVFLMLSP